VVQKPVVCAKTTTAISRYFKYFLLIIIISSTLVGVSYIHLFRLHAFLLNNQGGDK